MNAATREFTDYIRFRSGAIQRWLDAFMNFHAPDPEDEASKGKWNNPGHLGGFWFDFLKTETLDVDDRVDNERRIPAYPPRLSLIYPLHLVLPRRSAPIWREVLLMPNLPTLTQR